MNTSEEFPGATGDTESLSGNDMVEVIELKILEVVLRQGVLEQLRTKIAGIRSNQWHFSNIMQTRNFKNSMSEFSI